MVKIHLYYDLLYFWLVFNKVGQYDEKITIYLKFYILSNLRAKKLFSHVIFVSAQNYKICCELNNIRCLRVSNTISFFLLNILGCQRRIFIYVLAIVYQRFILWHRNIDVFVEQLYKRNAQLVPFNFAIIVQFTVYSLHTIFLYFLLLYIRPVLFCPQFWFVIILVCSMNKFLK